MKILLILSSDFFGTLMYKTQLLQFSQSESKESSKQNNDPTKSNLKKQPRFRSFKRSLFF